MVRGVALGEKAVEQTDYRHSPEYAEHLRTVFSRNLREHMRKRGWNQSEMARRANNSMPKDATQMTRDNISRYARGENYPGPERMEGLCKALGIKYAELVPEDERLTEDEYLRLKSRPRWKVDLNTSADGCRLFVDANVPFEIGVKVFELLRPYAPPVKSGGDAD